MEDIFQSAFLLGEKEFAWKKDDIPVVVNILRTQNKAIFGAEVWILTKDKKIKELYFFDFQIHDKLDSESWSDYVLKTSAEFTNSFHLLKENRRIIEEKLAEDGEVYFNISFVSEEEYQNLNSKW